MAVANANKAHDPSQQLYAERDAMGRITDAQTYKRAHGQDVQRKAQGEGKKG
jgi:hypothetical protein